MFYSDSILCRKGPLAAIWLAAHWERKLTKQQITNTDIPASIQELDHMPPMALRLKGQLLLGMTRIYGKKAMYLTEDCNETIDRMKDHIPNQPPTSENTSTVNFPKDPTAISLQGLASLSTASTSADLFMNISMMDMDAIMQHHTTKHDIPLPISQRHPPASPLRVTHAEAPDIENMMIGLEFDPSEFPQWEELISYENLSQNPKKPKLDDDIEVPRGLDLEQDIELARRAPSLDHPPRLSDIVVNDQPLLEMQQSPVPKQVANSALEGFDDGNDFVSTIPNPLETTPIHSHSPKVSQSPISPIGHQSLQNPFKVPLQIQRKHKRSQSSRDNRLPLDSETEIIGHVIQSQLKDTSDIIEQLMIQSEMVDFSRIYESCGLSSKSFDKLYQFEHSTPETTEFQHVINRDDDQGVVGFEEWNEEQPIINNMELDEIATQDIETFNHSNISEIKDQLSIVSEIPDILAPLMMNQTSDEKNRILLKQMIKDSMSKLTPPITDIKQRRLVSMSFLSILERASVDKRLVLEQPDGPFRDIFITII